MNSKVKLLFIFQESYCLPEEMLNSKVKLLFIFQVELFYLKSFMNSNGNTIVYLPGWSIDYLKSFMKPEVKLLFNF